MKIVGHENSDYITSVNTLFFSPFLCVGMTRRVMTCLFPMNYDTPVCWSLNVLAYGYMDTAQLLIQSPISRYVRLEVIVSPPLACCSAQWYFHSTRVSFSGVWRTGHLLTLPHYLSWQSVCLSPLRKEKCAHILKLFLKKLRMLTILTCSLQTLRKMITRRDVVSILTFHPT